MVIVFVAPNCGPCRTVLPDLGRWQATLSDRLTVAVISSGTLAENRPVAGEHGINEMLVQEEYEVSGAYRLRNTPSALVVAPEGAIATSPVEGPLPIEQLVRLTLRRLPTAPTPGPVAPERS